MNRRPASYVSCPSGNSQLGPLRWPSRRFVQHNGKRYGSVRRLGQESFETALGKRGHAPSFRGERDTVAYG